MNDIDFVLYSVNLLIPCYVAKYEDFFICLAILCTQMSLSSKYLQGLDSYVSVSSYNNVFGKNEFY